MAERSDSKKSSPIWEYFIIDSDNSNFAICTLCWNKLSRGVTPKQYSTSPMIQHLRTKHSTEYKVYGTNGEEKARSTQRQVALNHHEPKYSTRLSVVELEESAKTWDIKSAEAMQLHRAIGKMIIIDLLPYEVVEREGFKELIATLETRYVLPPRQYFADKIIPEMQIEVEESLGKMLRSAGNVSFTVDTWKTEDHTYFGLVAHWLSDDFSKKSYVLECMERSGHRAGLFQKSLSRWHVELVRCHLVLCDAKSSTSFSDLGLTTIPHFEETVQSVVDQVVLCQKNVSSVITVCCNVVDYFGGSGDARLQDFHRKLGTTKHWTFENVIKNWKRLYLMLEAMVEHEAAIEENVSKCDDVDGMSSEQWGVAKDVVRLFGPLREAADYISSRTACISELIPLVTGLKAKVERTEEDVTGVEGTRAVLLEALATHFPLHGRPACAFATVLDPRFKTRFFSETERFKVTMEMEEKFERMETLAPGTASAQTSNGDTKQPSQKRPRLESASLFDYIDDLLEEKNDRLDGRASIRSAGALELDRYLTEPLVPRSEDPFSWWKENRERFPVLASLAIAYLGAPLSGIPSERLFLATAGRTDGKRPSHVLPDDIERLLFLKYNVELVH